MKSRQNQIESAANSEKAWQETPYHNLWRYVSSGTYLARIRVKGKLVRRSLKTSALSVAKMRLLDLEREERRKAEHGRLVTKAKLLFQDALAALESNGFRPVVPRNKKDAKALKPAAFAYYQQRGKALLKSWPGLAKMDIGKVGERDCQAWASRMRKQVSASAFNHTLGLLRNVIDYGIKAGARYDNPARAIMRESESPKPLELPDPTKFNAFVTAIATAGGRFSKAAADLVQFLAFGGFRKGEAEFVRWADCDFERGLITVRGHPDTGLKNRTPGEFRVVPMIPDLRRLLERLKAARPNAQAADAVMMVNECQKAMDRAAELVGMKRISHHDLRHLFATTCIESGVDIPTVSRWLGHSDGGALAMRTYGHLRDHHSVAMAAKVSFSQTPAANVVQLPKERVA